MNKTAVVYWSGTGNTEAMANAVAEGARKIGTDVDIFTAAEFNSSMVINYGGIAFGCPSMGAEVLEELEFEPMWEDVKDSLGGKKIVLFGSYGWGDGEWMRTWEENAPCSIEDTFICNEVPDNDDLIACNQLGETISK